MFGRPLNRIALASMESRTYRAHVRDRSLDIAYQDGELTVDGTPVTFSFVPIEGGYYSLLVDGRSLPVVVEPVSDDRMRVTIAGRTTEIRVQDEHDLLLERFGLEEALGPAEREIRAPMPGLVLDVMVDEGQSVEAGDALLVLEAMKMENELQAPGPGTVHAVHVQPEDAVDKDELLIEIEAA